MSEVISQYVEIQFRHKGLRFAKRTALTGDPEGNLLAVKSTFAAAKRWIKEVDNGKHEIMQRRRVQHLNKIRRVYG